MSALKTIGTNVLQILQVVHSDIDIYANVPQISNPYRQNQANVIQTTTAAIKQLSSKPLPPDCHK